MKSVILFRHGKSDWDVPYGNDHERPLAKRGVEAAKKMGKFLYEKNQTPELVISSTAVRAKTTVELAMDSANWTSKLVLERGIYGGSPDFLLELIHNQNDIYSSICLVGHEPNFSMFISRATNDNYVHFTTANMAKINFDTQEWSRIFFGDGTLEWHQKPKEIKE